MYFYFLKWIHHDKGGISENFAGWRVSIPIHKKVISNY